MSYPTWSDPNSQPIVPPSGARHLKSIGPVAVMVSCEPDLKWVLSQYPVKTQKQFISSTLMECKNSYEGISIVGPFVGAPYAVMLLETLIAQGVSHVFVIGWCGAVSNTLGIGDIILAKEAIVDEGTSASYLDLEKKRPVSIPDHKANRLIKKQIADLGLNPVEGTIWTTDAIYRETPEKVRYFKELGADCVDMECSALFSVAAFRNVSIGAALVVSDMVLTSGWEPGFNHKAFKTGRQAACKSVMQAAQIQLRQLQDG